MALFTRKSPTQGDLISAAEDDYRRSSKALEKVRGELAEIRHAQPSMADSLEVLREMIAQGTTDFTEIVDKRLDHIAAPEFDRRYLADVDLTRDFRNGSVLGVAALALLSDEILAFAEARLKAKGADKSRLTLAEKAKKMATLQAAEEELSGVRDSALTTWRKLTGNKTGYPE